MRVAGWRGLPLEGLESLLYFDLYQIICDLARIMHYLHNVRNFGAKTQDQLSAYNPSMTTTPKQTPATPSERVQKANAALVARGGRRMPAGYLQPDVTQALQDLIKSGYAASPVAVINAAILDAQKKVKRM